MNKRGRFEPGKSGNYAGRPSGSRNLKSILAKLIAEKYPVMRDGKWDRLPVIDLLFLALRKHALAGNLQAIDAVRQRLEKADAGSSGGLVVVPHADPEFWEEYARQHQPWIQRRAEQFEDGTADLQEEFVLDWSKFPARFR